MEQSASDSEPDVPAGIGSEITTPADTVDGPLFVTVMVYVVDAPAVTDETPSLFVIDRSAERATVSVSVAELFPADGSDTGDDVIEAVFETAAGTYPDETSSVS